VRGRPPTYSRRYHLTLEPAEADVLDAYAEQEAKPPATIAARLLVTALRRATAGEEDELAAAHRQLEQLRTANAAMRRRLSEVSIDAVEPPRWERPMPDLLADRDWWSTWLPRLHQLLGRQRHQYQTNRVQALDGRGYPDLLNHLFPPVRDRGGRTLVEWHSPFYADHARHAWEAAQPAGRSGEGGSASARAAVWEPVVRHVAAALCALEVTATPGSDPVLRFRVEDEIAGGWLQTLHRLAGSDAVTLPDLQG
jgi:hypothetical protein